MNAQETIDQIKSLLYEIQSNAEDFAVGGIGRDGASQAELDDAGAAGGYFAGDAEYHHAQQIWLLADRAIQIVGETKWRPCGEEVGEA